MNSEIKSIFREKKEAHLFFTLPYLSFSLDHTLPCLFAPLAFGLMKKRRKSRRGGIGQILMGFGSIAGLGLAGFSTVVTSTRWNKNRKGSNVNCRV
jgi:hypothetical protein